MCVAVYDSTYIICRSINFVERDSISFVKEKSEQGKTSFADKVGSISSFKFFSRKLKIP